MSTFGKIELLREFGKEAASDDRFKKHQSAFILLKYYIENMWTIDANKQYPQARKMHVMSGMIWPAVVTENLPLSRSSVQRANKLLEEWGYLRITWGKPRGGKEMPVDIEVVLDGESLAHKVENKDRYINPNRHDDDSETSPRTSPRPTPNRHDDDSKRHDDDSKRHGAAHKDNNRKRNTNGAAADAAEQPEPCSSSESASVASEDEKMPQYRYLKQTNQKYGTRFGKIRRVSGNEKARPGEEETTRYEYDLQQLKEDENNEQ